MAKLSEPLFRGLFQRLMESPLVARVSGGGGSAEPPVVTYESSAKTSLGTTVYTFSSQAIGTAAENRYVLVGVGSRQSSGPSVPYDSLTVGGIAATRLVGEDSIAAFGRLEYWIVLVPTGTTADIVITAGTAQLHMMCFAWSIQTDVAMVLADSDMQGNSSADSDSASVDALIGDNIFGLSESFDPPIYWKSAGDGTAVADGAFEAGINGSQDWDNLTTRGKQDIETAGGTDNCDVLLIALRQE